MTLCPCGCGKPPRDKSSRLGPAPRYASHACVKRVWDRAHPRPPVVQAPRDCAHCGGSFVPRNPRGTYCSRKCKDLARTAKRIPRRRRPGQGLSDRAWHLRAKYDISVEQYDAMLENQGGVCGICCQPSDGALHVDHDHATHFIRGLLCRKCNMALGLFQDDARIAQAATTYLQRSLNG
jgi:hypothetical protein